MKKEIYTDQELVDGIKFQNSNCILFMYKKNYKSVKYFIEKESGCEKDAEDVFQDAMIFLYHKIRNNELQLKSSIHTYLIGVTKIYWLRCRKKKMQFVYDIQDEAHENLDYLNDIIILERKQIFIDHFKELSKDCLESSTEIEIQHKIEHFFKVNDITRTRNII